MPNAVFLFYKFTSAMLITWFREFEYLIHTSFLGEYPFLKKKNEKRYITSKRLLSAALSARCTQTSDTSPHDSATTLQFQEQASGPCCYSN
jgi:hypothetical protein